MNDVLLKSVELRKPKDAAERFPFTVPAIAGLERLEFTAPVCFLVGDNGSGKSTLLEAIAAAANLPTAGSVAIAKDGTLAAQRRFAKSLRLSWSRLEHRGFFLRAEDFFGFIKHLAAERAEALSELREVQERYKEDGRSDFATDLATGPLRASVHAMDERYGADPDAQSHGESFLNLFRSRIVPRGLFLLDEPEAPLSPNSQFAFMSMIREAVKREAQFIIATHSPLLLAYPGAQIISFDAIPPVNRTYAELENVNVMRDFLNNPQRFLRHLFVDGV